MNQYEQVVIATSSTLAGAVNKSENGSQFEIVLAEPLIFPNDLINCTIQVDEATIWWTIPNISDSLNNNKFYITHLTIPYIITIPNGLYSVTDLQIALDRELFATIGISGLVTLEADNSTQKTSLTINQAGTQIDFTPVDTFRNILGFNSQLVPALVSTGIYTQLSDNVAAFNSIDYFLIHSDIVDQGIRTNNIFTQTIYQVLIDVAPGSQIVSREFNPPKNQLKLLLH